MPPSGVSRKPVNWFPILAVVVPCLWALSVWLRDWPLAAIAAMTSVYLIVDTVDLVRKKRAAREASKSSSQEAPRRG